MCLAHLPTLVVTIIPGQFSPGGRLCPCRPTSSLLFYGWRTNLHLLLLPPLQEKGMASSTYFETACFQACCATVPACMGQDKNILFCCNLCFLSTYLSLPTILLQLPYLSLPASIVPPSGSIFSSVAGRAATTFPPLPPTYH